MHVHQEHIYDRKPFIICTNDANPSCTRAAKPLSNICKFCCMLCDLDDHINISVMTHLSRLAAGEQKIIVVLVISLPGFVCQSERHPRNYRERLKYAKGRI